MQTKDTQTDTPFVCANHVHWKMVAYQNVIPDNNELASELVKVRGQEKFVNVTFFDVIFERITICNGQGLHSNYAVLAFFSFILDSLGTQEKVSKTFF